MHTEPKHARAQKNLLAMPPMAPAPMPAMDAVIECTETALMPTSDASVAADGAMWNGRAVFERQKFE